jgi:membrane-associated protease RseP (regulator of RpoE activity)
MGFPYFRQEMVMRTHFRNLTAGMAALAFLAGGHFVSAQIPAVGGGGLPGGPSVGPAVGPTVGPGVVPTVPGVPGVPGVPNVGPNNNLPNNNVRNVVPGNNNNNRLNIRDQNVGQNMPLTVQGVTGKAVGNDGALGAMLDNRNGRLRISKLDDGSLFNISGFRVGDQILAVNRNWVRSLGDFSGRLSAAAQAEGNASVYIVRDGVRQWVNVDFSGATKPVLGIQSIDKDGQVVITSVTQASAAADAGLQVGDRIVSLNGKSIDATADLTAEITAAAEIGELNIDIVRDGAKQTLKAAIGVARDANAIARRKIELVHDRVDHIRAEVAEITNNVNDKVRDDVNQLRDRVETLSQRVRNFAQEGVETARNDVEQVRDSASAIRARAHDLADDAKDTTRGSLDRIHDEMGRLRSDVMAFVSVQKDAVQDLSGNTREGLTNTAKGINDDLRTFAGNAKDNARGAVTEVSDLAKNLHEDVANLGDGADLRDRLDAARDRASQLRNRLGDFREGNLADAIDRAKLDDLRDRTAALRDRLNDLRNDRFGDFAQNVKDKVQNTVPNGNQGGDLRDRLSQQIDGIRDRVGNLDLGDADNKDIGDRVNAIRERVAAGFDGDEGRFDQFHDQLHDLRGRINQLARERGDDDALQDVRDRVAAFMDNVHDYFDDRFDGRDIGDRLAEKTGTQVK